SVSLGCYKKTIDKTGGCWRIINGNQQENTINIRRNNMHLLGKINRFSYDIILALVDLINSSRNRIRSFIDFKIYNIANGNRIRTPNPLNAKFSFDTTFDKIIS